MASQAITSEVRPSPAESWLTRLVTALSERVADCGRTVIGVIIATGDLAIFFWRMLRWLPCWPRRGTLPPCFYQVGVLSLPVVALTGTFFGMIVAVQCYFQFHAVGMESRLGAVINMTLVRELGPVLAAVMLAGRVGSAMAAELGTMRVTEQIDALSSMGANPIHYLVVPRFLACLVLIPALTLVADFMGVVGGFGYCVWVLRIDEQAYWKYSSDFVSNADVLIGLFKSVFFGAAIAVISCHRGFHCGPGAEGVGRAATAAFVYSFITIIAVDLGIGIALNMLYALLWPDLVTIV